jgi:hypothetical protein
MAGQRSSGGPRPRHPARVAPARPRSRTRTGARLVRRSRQARLSRTERQGAAPSAGTPGQVAWAVQVPPPENGVVLCVDKKAQTQALEPSQPLLPRDLGQAERRSRDDLRHGTAPGLRLSRASPAGCSGLCIVDIGWQSLRSARTIDPSVPPELDVPLVKDPAGTEKTQPGERGSARRTRFPVHFTPTAAGSTRSSALWLRTPSAARSAACTAARSNWRRTSGAPFQSAPNVPRPFAGPSPWRTSAPGPAASANALLRVHRSARDGSSGRGP